MKASLFLFFVVFCASLSAQPDPIKAQSEIREVTVYPNQARITRAAKVALPAGASLVRIEGLPTLLDDNSVQASGKSSAALVIDSLEVWKDMPADTPNAALKKLREELLALQDSNRALVDKKDTLREQADFLRELRSSLVSTKKGKSEDAASLVDIQETYHFYTKELASIAQQQLEIEKEQRPLEKAIARAQQEVDRLQNPSQPKTKSVLIALQSDRATEAVLEIHYVVGNASWTPLYTARADSSTGAVEFSSQAIVRQQTGEAWKDVRLRLSTSRPSAGASMPEIFPLWLDFFRPLPVAAPSSSVRGQAFGLTGAPVNYAAKAAETTAHMADATQTSANVQASGFSAVFEVKLPTTVFHYNEPVKTTLATHKLDGELQYAATPVLDNQAYLQVKLKNTSPTPWLAGLAHIFRDGDMVGSAHLKYIPVEDAFDLPLGIDEAVKITHRLLVDKEDKTGLINKRNTHERKAEIVVENTRSSPIRITLHDRVPVSRQGDIVIGNLQFDPAPAKQDKDDGRFSWELKVDAKAKNTATFGYKVEWPKDQNITGL